MKSTLFLILLLVAGSGALFAQTPEPEYPSLGSDLTGQRMSGEVEFMPMGPGGAGHRVAGRGGVMGQGGMSDMMGAGPGTLALHPLIPPGKRDQIRELHLSLLQSMTTKMAELQNQRLAMMKAVHSFPADQAAAKSAREAMLLAMGEMMSQRFDAMVKVQQILGKELWEQVHPEWFGPRMGMAKEGPLPSR